MWAKSRTQTNRFFSQITGNVRSLTCLPPNKIAEKQNEGDGYETGGDGEGLGREGERGRAHYLHFVVRNAHVRHHISDA